MEFGYHTTSYVYEGAPAPEQPVAEKLVGHAQLLEAGGFSWFTLMDHFWQLPGIGHPEEPTLECYAGLSALARETDEMELSGLVTCVHYRNPALLAKEIASLDALSGGRALLSIGAGWFDDEYEAAGIEFPDPATRVRQLRDAVRLVDAALTQDSPVDYDGEYYDLDGFYCEPSADVPVMIGGGGEQLTLRVTAEYADRWNIPGVGPDTYEHKLEVLADHCEDLGRDYDDIEKTVTVNALLREDSAAARSAYRSHLEETPDGPPAPDDVPAAVGTPAEVAAVVETFGDLGVEMFQIEVPKNDRRTAELFVDEVLPQF
ncbi:LLM class flavin-dependent oxidoreductase [Halomontanus rarus]|uniref:LLM class flavin-dependent oxidoreductase n=1 Tax=Halomontanus rarus TaxID=3034020 RepID=UPI001A980E06